MSVKMSDIVQLLASSKLGLISFTFRYLLSHANNIKTVRPDALKPWNGHF